jgi:acyl carrier protein
MSADQGKSVEETLRKIIGKILHNNNVVLTPSTTFRDLGADSLDVVKTIVALEDAFGIEMADEDLKNIVNIGGLIEYVGKKVAAKS